MAVSCRYKNLFITAAAAARLLQLLLLMICCTSLQEASIVNAASAIPTRVLIFQHSISSSSNSTCLFSSFTKVIWVFSRPRVEYPHLPPLSYEYCSNNNLQWKLTTRGALRQETHKWTRHMCEGSESCWCTPRDSLSWSHSPCCLVTIHYNACSAYLAPALPWLLFE